MAYDAKVLRRATARLEQSRKEREEALQRRRKEIFSRLPEAADIDRQIRGTCMDIIRSSFLTRRDPGPALAAIRDKNMDLQVRLAQLLESAGYPPDALDDVPACKKCGDSGWVKGEMCDCLKALCAQEQVKELSKLLDLGEQSFDTFSLDWYSPLPWPGESLSPRENMEFLCAQKFGKFYFQNLFLTGNPGLGKTFLSACVARTVAENGFSVVYDTAVNLFAQFEEQKFGKDADGSAQAEARRYLSCDLLILDDLGSELTTQFTQSALYELVNTRLVGEKHTVISSNLSMAGVRERYNGQTASRLEGEYRVLRFYGDDIRLLRKAKL